jgi:ornithine cyclodeaminase
VLDRAATAQCVRRLDPVAVVADVLERHAAGGTVLPAEGYLPWTNAAGAACRSLAMLGGLLGDRPVYGMKLINAAVDNPGRGLERAGGLGLLFDPRTARPALLVEAGHLSAVRTAAYTLLSLRHLGPAGWDRVALVGCGTLARAHLQLLARYHPGLQEAVVTDVSPERAWRLAEWAAGAVPEVRVRCAGSAAAAVRDCPVVVTVTTSSTPYLGTDAFAPGTFVAHVSLDDLRSEVFLAAEAVFVDDVELVRDNPRRILGRLMADGVVAAPGAGPGRPLAGTLADVLAGRRPAVRPRDGVVVSNPFGMAVLDVGLYAAVGEVAAAAGIGTDLDVSEELP